MVRKLIASSIVGCALALSGAASAFATGQPGASNGVTCFSSPSTTTAPGNSMSSLGSVFNPAGQSGTVYAGNPGTASLAHANSPNAVSQYDIACLRVTSH
jgi:hypothetical protein